MTILYSGIRNRALLLLLVPFLVQCATRKSALSSARGRLATNINESKHSPYERLPQSVGADIYNALCKGQDNRFSVLNEWTDCETYEYVRRQATIWNGYAIDRITLDLFWIAHQARQRGAALEIAKTREKISSEWYKEPFYYLYVQYFGSKAAGQEGTFESLMGMLDYLEALGIRNLYLLPHYESPLGDNGYDVSDYRAADRLGGEAQFEKFMAVALERGFRVVTDAVYNHTSVEHPWFQRAKQGDSQYLNYYLLVDDWQVVNPKGEQDSDGTWFMRYQSSTGEKRRLVVFPDVEKKHFLEIAIPPSDEEPSRVHKVYREFYPFQVDLNLQNPDVIAEIFQITANEFLLGTLGKRNDAILWWVKPPESETAVHQPETYALHKIFKVFLRSLNSKSIMIPEAVDAASNITGLIGEEVTINGRKTVDQGDAMFNFQLQNALRESLYLQNASAVTEYLQQNEQIHSQTPRSAVWLNLLGHHDEMYLGFVRTQNRAKFREYVINTCKGKLFKANLSAGGRYADCLENNKERRKLAISLLYSLPGVPAIYYGDEIGATSQLDHAVRRQESQYAIFAELQVPVSFEQSFDAREMHRGPISADEFYKALKEEDPGVMLIQAFSKIWTPTFSSNSVVTFSHEDQTALYVNKKYVNDGKTSPLLWVANLGDRALQAKVKKEAFIHIGEGSSSHTLDVTSLLSGESLKSEKKILQSQGEFYIVNLPPYGFEIFSQDSED